MRILSLDGSVKYHAYVQHEMNSDDADSFFEIEAITICIIPDNNVSK